MEETALTDQTLRLRWSESYNRHWAGARGADHANHAGSVVLSISAEGRCRVTDTGRMVDSVLDGDQHEETTTTWNSRWQGKCRLVNAKLELDLGRDGAGTCTKSIATRRGAQHFAPTKEKCVLAERLELECETYVVESASSKDDLSDKLERVEAWNCGPGEAHNVEGVGSPLGWVFGKDRCLERRGGSRPGSGPLRYATCEK